MGACTTLQIDEQEKQPINTENTPPVNVVEVLHGRLPWIPTNNCHKHIRKLLHKPEIVARGNTATILSAKYKDKLCAVKQVERNTDFGRMVFTTEAKVLSKLNHNSIIKYIDVLMDEKYYYLILEQADYSLHQLITAHKYLSEQDTKSIIYNILQAISYIHRKNLTHRDLKPENIVFMKETNVPKIIDFGDAEMAKENKMYTEFVGTPIYMSPARLKEYNSEELKKSDIWAIGCMTYELFTGAVCFKGNSEKEVFTNILNGRWSWNITRIPSVDMQEFVKQCLHMDIQKRFYVDDALKHAWFDDIKLSSL